MIGDFDPTAYAHRVRERPENYIRMDVLIRQMAATAPLRAAKTLDELRKRFTEATRAAKGDEDLVAYLKEVKDRRKQELADVVPEVRMP